MTRNYRSQKEDFALMEAILKDDVFLLMKLVEDDVCINRPFDDCGNAHLMEGYERELCHQIDTYSGDPPLSVALQKKSYEIVEFLLEYGNDIGLDVNVKNRRLDGYAPIIYACYGGFDILKKFLQLCEKYNLNLDINIKDNFLRTPLCLVRDVIRFPHSEAKNAVEDLLSSYGGTI